MVNCCVVLAILFSSTILSMHSKRQLEICPGRNAYILKSLAQKSDKKEPTPCVFCDENVLAKNYILGEDYEHDLRWMMNLHRYFNQGKHLLVMPISHVEHPDEFSRNQLKNFADKAQELCAKLSVTAYSQEYVTHWGKIAGQSVAHWHSHLKNYEEQPLSLSEKMKRYRNEQVVTIEEVFTLTKEQLKSVSYIPALLQQITKSTCECHCCSMMNNQEEHEDNLIVAQFEYNYVCLSNYPCLPAELAVVPKRHVSSMKDLSQDEFREHVVVTMALLPKVREYAQNFIRNCDGGILYTKNIGDRASIDEQKQYHVHTIVAPRTEIPITLGTLEGHSCKLDFDPGHFLQYLKNKHDELSTIVK